MNDVSVVIPVHNGARYLAEAIDSVLAQTYPRIETIVVDDGSTDESLAVARRYGAQVRVLAHEQRGPAAARNTGLRAASGRHVAFLDCDDRLLPAKVASQVALLDARPEVGAVVTGWQLIDDRGRVFGRPHLVRAEEYRLRWLVLHNVAPPVAVMVRRTLLDEVGGFDESLRLTEDWDLSLRLSRRGVGWAAIDEPLCEYRIHDHQGSGQVDVMLANRLRLLEQMFRDPRLSEETRALEAAALQQAYLRAAADWVRTGDRVRGHEAFAAGVRLRPRWVAEPRNLARFCRWLLPPGHQHQAEIIAERRRLVALVRAAMDGVFARDDLEPAVRRWRAAAWLATWRLRARLARKRLPRSAPAYRT